MKFSAQSITPYGQQSHSSAMLTHPHVTKPIINLLLHGRSKRLARIKIKPVGILPVIVLAGFLSFAVLTSVFLFGIFLAPKTITYNFAGGNCYFNPVLLPKTIGTSGSSSLSHIQKPKISVNDYPLLSTASCVHITQLPEQGTERITLETPILFSKNVSVKIKKAPQLKSINLEDTAVALDDSLFFEIDKTDTTFSYGLSIDSKSSSCNKESTQIACPLDTLDLAQGNTYDYSVQRMVGDDSKDTLSGTVTLLNPVYLSSPIVKNDQTVYENIDTIELLSDKPLTDVNTVSLKQGDAEVQTTVEFKDDKITLAFDAPLARAAEFVLTINDATSTDGAFLAEPYVLKFKTSAGPTVTSTNIGTFKVSTGTTVRIAFDVSLATDQNLAGFANITIGGNTIPTITTVYENTVSINPVSNLPACTNFKVNVSNGLTSIHGVSGGSAWSYSSKTICQQAFSVGVSTNGAGITGYRFGSGATTIVFVGGIHGNEKSSVRTLRALMDELEIRYSEIPADKTIIIIPLVNPDGYAASSRTNAPGIDLNRNFPANDWNTDVYQPGNVLLPGGGGVAPLSETESTALAAYIQSANPQLVLTYHAVARSVIYNGSGNSAERANTYASLVGYSSYGSSQEDGIFAYPTTGEFETWLNDRLSVPTLLVELSTMSGNEIVNHKPGMWAMIK